MIARACWMTFVVAGLLTVAIGMRGPAVDPGAAMTAQAQKFLGALDDAQRRQATMSYDDPAHLNWHFIPMPERKGLQVKNMNADQRKLALELLKSAMSQVGYDKATEIMSLEGILRDLEKTRKDGPIRDPERYYYTIFGAPGDTGSWGLSVEGHHMSLNFVVRDGKLLGHTPAFFSGANPALVKNAIEGYPKPGTRTLAKEEQYAFDLYAGLDDGQRKTALIAEKAPMDIRGPVDRQPLKTAYEGLAAKKMTDAQKQTLLSLLEAYCANMPEGVGAIRLQEVKQAGLDEIHFAWAGSDKPGVGHYYRVQGPTFLVEFVNVQPDAAGNPANHIHCVWRDLRGDFGIKL